MVGRLSLRDVPELPDARKRGDAGLDSPDSGLPPSPGPAHPHWPLSAGSPERAAHGGLPEPEPSASIPAAAVRPGRSGRYGREGREVRSRERRVGPGSGLWALPQGGLAAPSPGRFGHPSALRSLRDPAKPRGKRLAVSRGWSRCAKALPAGSIRAWLREAL